MYDEEITNVNVKHAQNMHKYAVNLPDKFSKENFENLMYSMFFIIEIYQDEGIRRGIFPWKSELTLKSFKDIFKYILNDLNDEDFANQLIRNLFELNQVCHYVLEVEIMIKEFLYGHCFLFENEIMYMTDTAFNLVLNSNEVDISPLNNKLFKKWKKEEINLSERWSLYKSVIENNKIIFKNSLSFIEDDLTSTESMYYFLKKIRDYNMHPNSIFALNKINWSNYLKTKHWNDKDYIELKEKILKLNIVNSKYIDVFEKFALSLILKIFKGEKNENA